MPTYPFGQPLTPVIQTDRRPKRVFVLGVYASAVHARWMSPEGKVKVRALAVASEPEIFWRGEGAAAIIRQISMPASLGHLVPADARLNGPSGVVLDERFLAPLGVTRQDAWLCDLLPESRLNPSQRKALDREYMDFVRQGLVPDVTIPPVPRRFCDDDRAAEIVEEILASQAPLLVTLGDIPLREFVARFEPKWAKLSVFGQTAQTYGQEHPLTIGGHALSLLPLVHPRQAGRLGASSGVWAGLHGQWVGMKLGNREAYEAALAQVPHAQPDDVDRKD